MSAHTMEVGGVLPKFVTPSDVRDLKNRVDPFVRALDQSVASCATMTDPARASWSDFSKQWRTYFTEEDSWWHTAAQMDQGESYERDVARWQDWFAQFHCAPNSPRITPSTSTPEPELWQGTIKTVAIAGAVVALALGLRAVMK